MGKCEICGEKTLAKELCPKHYQDKFRHDRYLRHREREIRVSKDRNRKIRQDLLASLGFAGKCQKCGAGIDDSQKRSSFVVENKIICLQCWNESKKINKFARNYDNCIRCGTNSVGEHFGNGLCEKCYSERRHRKEKQSVKN
jgi:hypothetical protein